MKTDLLEKIGLNDNEAKIYRALLLEGAKTPPELATVTGVTRANTYFVLQSLMSKGLAERKDRKKKFLYYPLNPHRLSELIEDEKRAISEKEKVLDALVPELANMFKIHSNKPSVAYFEGMEGARTLMNDIFLQKPTEAVIFRSPLDDESLGADFARKHALKLKRAGIAMKIISPIEGGKLFTEVNDEKMLREVKYVSKALFNSEITIYGSRIAILTYGKTKVSMLIENKELAITLRSIFDIMWENIK